MPQVSTLIFSVFHRSIVFLLRLGSFEMFINAVKLVTTDKGYDIGTEQAQKARLVAHKLLKASEDDEECVTFFACWLIEEVSKCCTHPRAVTCHTFRERMWEKFYKLHVLPRKF